MTQLAVLSIGAGALASLAAAVSVLAFADRPFRARLGERVFRSETQIAAPLAASITPGMLTTLARWGERAGRGSLDKGARGSLRERLVQAGYYSQRAPEAFFGIRAAAAVVGGLLTIALAIALHLSPLVTIIVLMVAANLGLFAPNLVLASRIRRRRQAMHDGLPDAIDLMVVAVEAGATVSSALQRVVAEFGALHPVVGEQFGLMLMEMQAGASRAEALARLARRCTGDEVRAMTTLLIQSEAVGASLGGALRVFAQEMRKTRYLEAERKAAELPVKLAFPLVFCIFPCLASVIFIPVFILLLRTFFQS